MSASHSPDPTLVVVPGGDSLNGVTGDSTPAAPVILVSRPALAWSDDLPLPTPEHLEYLAERGIPREVAVTLYRSCGSDLLIPFRNPEGELYRILSEDEKADGQDFIVRRPFPEQPGKFRTPTAGGNRPYFSPLMPKGALEKTDWPVVFIEGPVKVDACWIAIPSGYRFIGLNGVWGFLDGRDKAGVWRRSREETSHLPELKLIPLAGKRVIVLFDSDSADNPSVYNAGKDLASWVKTRGGQGYRAILPPKEDGTKNGADDYIVGNGAAALIHVMESAKPIGVPLPLTLLNEKGMIRWGLDPAERRQLMAEIAKVTDMDVRDDLTRMSSRVLGISYRELVDQISDAVVGDGQEDNLFMPVGGLDNMGAVNSSALVPGMATRGELTTISGDGGIGKTWLMLDLALCVATGSPFLGFPVKRGRVLFVYLDGGDSFFARLKGAGFNDLPQGPTTNGPWSWAVSSTFDITRKRHVEHLKAMIDQVDLVVIDSARGLALPLNVDENHADFGKKIIRAVASWVSGTKAAGVLLLHNAKTTGKASGTGDIKAGCWALFNLKPPPGVAAEDVPKEGPAELLLIGEKVRDMIPPKLRIQRVFPTAVDGDEDQITRAEHTVLEELHLPGVDAHMHERVYGALRQAGLGVELTLREIAEVLDLIEKDNKVNGALKTAASRSSSIKRWLTGRQKETIVGGKKETAATYWLPPDWDGDLGDGITDPSVALRAVAATEPVSGGASTQEGTSLSLPPVTSVQSVTSLTTTTLLLLHDCCKSDADHLQDGYGDAPSGNGVEPSGYGVGPRHKPVTGPRNTTTRSTTAKLQNGLKHRGTEREGGPSGGLNGQQEAPLPAPASPDSEMQKLLSCICSLAGIRWLQGRHTHPADVAKQKGLGVDEAVALQLLELLTTRQLLTRINLAPPEFRPFIDGDGDPPPDDPGEPPGPSAADPPGDGGPSAPGGGDHPSADPSSDGVVRPSPEADSDQEQQEELDFGGPLEGCIAIPVKPKRKAAARKPKKPKEPPPPLPQEGDLGPLPIELLAIQGETTPLVIDLETQSAGLLWATPNGTGPFIRLVGSDHGISASPASLVDHAGALVAHNGFGFDFLALARHRGFDLLAMAEQGNLIDTMVLALALDPPEVPISGKLNGGQVRRLYSLNKCAERAGLPGKTDSLAKLAMAYAKDAGIEGKPKALATAGYGLIPRNQPDYVSYLQGDVTATRALFDHLCPGGELTPYAQREMRILGRLVAGITVAGTRLDVPLTKARYDEVEARKADCRALLVDRYGLPTHTTSGALASNPLSCIGAAEAIATAAADVGLELPTTPKTAKPSTSREHLGPMLEEARAAGRREQVDLLETVLGLTGARSIYGTALDNLQSDGRVHPQVAALQASGRLSITSPGITVFGKRGGRVVERAIFLPDQEDHVLVAADLAQIDMRAMAAHAQDPAYLELFEPGRDAHTEIAEAVGLTRDDAKQIGHGWNYGMSINGMVSHGVDEAKAQKFNSGMRRRFPKLVAWRDRIRKDAQGGKRLDNGFGRMMRPNPARAWTQAPALMGQGTARDLMMEAVLRLPLELVPMLRFSVHDELVLSIPLAEADRLEGLILKAMNFEWAPPGADLEVKVSAGMAKRGRNWADCYRKD